MDLGHFAFLVLPLAWLLGFATGRRRPQPPPDRLDKWLRDTHGRHPRGGGSTSRRASRKPRAAMSSTTYLTPFPAVSFSSSGELGNQLAGSAILHERFEANRLTALGSSGDATEARGANGQQPDSAGLT